MRTSLIARSLIALIFPAACSEPKCPDLPPPPPITASSAATPATPPVPAAGPPWLQGSVATLTAELVKRHGELQRPRVERGLRQVAGMWRDADGDAAAFASFVGTHFAPEGVALDQLFDRFERAIERIDGYSLEMARELGEWSALDLGPELPIDEIFAGYDPSAHVTDDFFQNKLAFIALLNFPLTTLEQRLKEGPSWSRRQWAEARLAQRFAKRVPGDVTLAIGAATARADNYISHYNIWMHHLVDAQGKRLFPPKLRLLSHWNLRDEIKASYSDQAQGLAKQRLIQRVMERIVDQSIPGVVVDNPGVDWDPITNRVTPAAVSDSEVKPVAAPDGAREPDTRYATLLEQFHAHRRADPYSPTMPTLIARRFEEGRELPEARVKEMLVAVLKSPLVPRVAKLIEARLGRKLEPFDIWYNGFVARGPYTPERLDAIVAQRYPTAAAYEKDMPRLLVALGFKPERARMLASRIAVDPARGSGHALGALMRGFRAHLRTRVEKGGMNYKGYNIAVHEMGHNVEQVFSLESVDHNLLRGVPNNAFTEALAFVFQGRDLELLGLPAPTGDALAAKTLNDFWATYEIAGVALVDVAVWHWMYEHPQATPAELREATLSIARDVWNQYYAPVLGSRDSVLLGIYSHMISYSLYLADYPIGHMIAFQIEEQMRKSGDVGAEFERMTVQGNIAPDLWMQGAAGQPVGPEALLAATERALAAMLGE